MANATPETRFREVALRRIASILVAVSRMLDSARQRLGLSATGGGGLEERVRDYAVAQSRRAATLLGGVILVVAYFVLALLEVVDFRRKMEVATCRSEHRGWKEPVHRIARDFQSYMVVRTGVGLLTGLMGAFVDPKLQGHYLRLSPLDVDEDGEPQAPRTPRAAGEAA